MKDWYNIRAVAIALICICTIHQSFSQEKDSTSNKVDSLQLPYKSSKTPTYQPNYRFGDPFSNPSSKSSLQLTDPSKVDAEITFDSSINYTIYERIGDVNFRPATNMSFEEYNRFNDQQMIKEYWREQSIGLDGESAVSGRRLIPKLYISPVFDRIFGGSYIDIRPTGFVNLDFGGLFQYIDNPQVPERQRRNGGFNFNMQISSNVVGNIGDKLAITFNFDNNNSFDFQQDMKIDFTGYEEDIIKKIELGNVSMPVSNSLIGGAQSLFGVKTQLQFGRLYVTGVASRQRGRKDVINLKNGVDEQQFEIRASMYDENRHFFLGQFFRDSYEGWLSNIPQVISGVNITRVEVYALNRNNNTQTTRNFVAYMDLGEGSKVYNPNIGSLVGGPTNNGANNLYSRIVNNENLRTVDGLNNSLESDFGMIESTDYVKVTTARKLDDTEFRVNKELGYISLIRKLQNDEVLAVAFEYTFNGKVYKVGELMEDYQGLSDDKLIFLKMLRPNKINTRVPTWDLMMKNIYNLNAGQVQKSGFNLRIHYRDDRTGIDNPSLHEGRRTKDKPLIELLGLDQLNNNNDRQRDGNFDYIEGITIDSRNGTIIFPVIEPLGRTLRSHFEDDEQRLIEKYVYDTLYRTTLNEARQVVSKDKYFIVGKFSGGSSSEIVLPGINVAPGSVIVTAGNTPLTEGLDYTVDYNLGRVRILNQGIMSSGKDIQISFEKADIFNFQTRWLTGLNFDYVLSDNFTIGATILSLNEKPGGISRYAIGDEPTKNTKYGFNINYQEESRFLTKMVDFIPLINTKEQSNIVFNAEFAQIIPGTSNIVEGKGTSYIDDFENATTITTNLQSWAGWRFAATPNTPERNFDLSNESGNNLGVNYRRAKMAWYTIDNSVFYTSIGGRRPTNIKEGDLENHYVKQVIPQDIYQQRDRTLVNQPERTLDIAYFPEERGPYNYNPNLTTGGFLRNPENNWAGITHPITGDQVDFDKSNIEYMEFWLLDPFIGYDNGDPRGIVNDGVNNKHNTSGGDVIFNLGSVSEDFMKDDRHAFENGLPGDGDLTKVTTNEWGNITNEQFLLNAFENSKSKRENQDVGMDGLKNESEAAHFNAFINSLNVTQQAKEKILEDPSGDNFQYYLGNNLDNADAQILERYKNYNGHEGNSPVSSNQLTQGSTQFPDNEDINKDNTISTLEEYYEYKLQLRPGQLEVGKQHIVDKVSDRSDATWYLFRVPIKNPDKIIGDVDGFKSIRFVRMYLTNFKEPVVLRMSNFRLVGSSWRKFEEPLNEVGLNEVPEAIISDFTQSVVNIEENGVGNDNKPPYVVPPGLNRDRDNTTFLNRRNNEQSLQICVEDLKDRDSRAVFKNVSGFDLINYGRIKMFFSAHANNGDNVKDDEVSAFLRFGTDHTENYYEIQVPLKITPTQLGGLGGNALERLVWPEENEIDLNVDELLGIKSERNRNDVNIQIPYSVISDNGRYKLTIKGRPDISSILTMMIGVRNTGSDDRETKSVCIWANELRVTDFDTKKGWAANARLSAKLADLATISASTRYTSIGFGSIQQRISERTREENIRYDISASVNVDKFLLPEKTGLKVPMFVSLENSRSIPQFDPLDPDVPLEAALVSFDTQKEKNEYSRLVEDRTTRRSINFTNVRKQKVKEGANRHIYDVENLSFSYAFSDQKSSSISQETYYRKTQSGGVSYNYAPKGFSIDPFGTSKAFKSPYLKLIKDINFQFLPSSLTLRGDLNRSFVHTQLYNDRLTIDGIAPYYERLFTFNRSYGLRWNPFRSLSLDYTARANSVIDEPDNIIEGDITTTAEKDYVLEQILGLGRMKNFSQDVSANYKLPLDKIPLTDWVSADYRFSVGYNWLAGSLNQTDTLGNSYGNTISNNRDQTISGKLDLVKLYNKVTFLKTANTPTRSNRSTRSGQDSNAETVKKPPNILNGMLRLLMSVRNFNITYSERETTGLSGFLPTAFLLGMDSNWVAPGWGFILGSQDPNIRHNAADNGWITQSPFLTSPFQQSLTQDLTFKASVEPTQDLKIQLDAKRSSSGSFQELFRYVDDSTTTGFNSLTPSRNGNYSISYLAINTSFESQNNNNSDAFNKFRENIDIIYGRVSNKLTGNGITERYDTISQDILIPAFLSAYSGNNVNSASLKPFPTIPIPNWRIDYAGLSKIPGLSDIFSSINVTHSYKSVFSINNYSNSLLYANNLTLDNDILDYPLASIMDSTSGNLVPIYIMNQVTIVEQFAPLIGINVRTTNNMNARIDYKRDRNMSLNLSNAQVTETRNNDISFDFGWTKKDLKLPWKVKGRTITINNDVTFRMGMTVRDAKTIQRKLEEDPKITNGNRNFQVRPSVGYKLNNQLDITAYFERSITDPRVGSFRRATTAFGVQLRFSLAQ